MNLAIIQARMGSTRFPGKVLKSINGEPMLIKQIKRISESSLIDKLIVATTLEEEDNQIVEVCKRHNIALYRGSTYNVLERFYDIAINHQPKNIIRLTGDCPLSDFRIIDKVIYSHIKNNNDYTSNTMVPTYPDGMDVEVMNLETLIKIKNLAKRPSHFEHVTLFINENSADFKSENILYYKNVSHIRLTVDEKEDLELIRIIDKELKEKGSYSLEDVLLLLSNNKRLRNLNGKFKRNEGLIKSLKSEES